MKIAINGAGVAGPALAYWLHRGGHEPILIERAQHFRAGGYVIDFWGVGYTVAEWMGVLPEIKQKGYSVQEVRFVDKEGNAVGGFGTAVLKRMNSRPIHQSAARRSCRSHLSCTRRTDRDDLQQQHLSDRGAQIRCEMQL